jgi:DNA-binding transcriptional LysR family regulator
MFEKLFSERGLSLDRLRVLVEIHDAGSIAQAAPGDLVRQSQYSRQLRELSEFFGCEVAQRRGKLLKLTAQGSRLAELARTQLRSLQDFKAECASEHIDYTIAAGDSVIHWLVIPRIGALMAKTPGIRFATTNVRTNEVVQQLSDGRADFGIVRKDAIPTGLKTAPLGLIEYIAAVPAALCKSRKPPSLKDVLSTLPIAAQTTDGQFTQRLRDIAASFAIEFNPALACQSFPQTLVAVRSGAFAAILPDIALQSFDEGKILRVKSDDLATLSRPLALAWNPRAVHVRPNFSKLVDQLKHSFVL